MIILKIIVVLLVSVLGLIISGFACLGASCFFDSLKKYERDARYFADEK